MTTTARFAAAPDVDYDRLEHWSHRAKCATREVDADWWFSPAPTKQGLATHICLAHCPVMFECDRHGVRPRGGVLAGRYWSDDSFPKPTRSQPMPTTSGCPYCQEAS